MKKILFFTALLASSISICAQHIEPTWESLNARPYPQWFSDAKLGIFIHWGLYSLPAYASKEGYGEWFYRGLMNGDADRRGIMSLYADTTLPILDQYKKLTDHWHAELWNPRGWARMFRDAGAKYVVLVTKHHDGYCLWDSPQQPEWNSNVSGPKRNIVEELTEAVRSEGLRMGFYYSLPEWTNPRHIWMKDPDSTIVDYVDNYMVPQFKELVTRYKPSLIFADGDWQNSAEQFRSKELIAWYYNLVGNDAIVNDRWGNGTQHGFKTPEYSAGLNINGSSPSQREGDPKGGGVRPWAECRGIGRSFGYNRNEDLDNFLTDRELIQHFCELVAHGGGLTLNVGPMADGTIPLIQQERLHALGHWLEVNGEAIYGAHPYSTSGGVVTPCQRTRNTAELPVSGTINYDWVRNAPLKGMPVDNYEIHWHGIYDAPEKGWYQFKAVADDEMTVVSAGDTLLYYNHAWAENKPGTMVLLKQNEAIELDVWYHEKDLEASAVLYVGKDGKDFVLADGEWHGTATWDRTLRCFTTKGDDLYIIEFERPGQTLTIPDMPKLKKGTQITLLGTTGTIKWKQKKDDTIILDLGMIDPKELNVLEHAWVFKIIMH